MNSDLNLTGELPPTATPDESTGLPWLTSWQRVYLFVLVVFVVYVLAMTTLSRMFA